MELGHEEGKKNNKRKKKKCSKFESGRKIVCPYHEIQFGKKKGGQPKSRAKKWGHNYVLRGRGIITIVCVDVTKRLFALSLNVIESGGLESR